MAKLAMGFFIVLKAQGLLLLRRHPSRQGMHDEKGCGR